MYKLQSMKRQSLMVLLLILCVSCKNSKSQIALHNDIGFRSIFSGKDLEGWRGDATYWRVENGILIGEVTPETILKQNSFIVYEKEQPEDFELKLEYKVSQSGNSGINYRSEVIKNRPFALKGYQCDIDGKNKYTGQNYEEKKCTTLAYMGESVTIPEMLTGIPNDNLRKNIKQNCWQTRTVNEARLESELRQLVKPEGWNKVHLIIKDNTMQHYINGVLFSEVIDLDKVNRSNKGFIGVQVHVGPPMKVEYKNIRLKLL